LFPVLANFNLDADVVTTAVSCAPRAIAEEGAPLSGTVAHLNTVVGVRMNRLRHHARQLFTDALDGSVAAAEADALEVPADADAIVQAESLFGPARTARLDPPLDVPTAAEESRSEEAQHLHIRFDEAQAKVRLSNGSKCANIQLTLPPDLHECTAKHAPAPLYVYLCPAGDTSRFVPGAFARVLTLRHDDASSAAPSPDKDLHSGTKALLAPYTAKLPLRPDIQPGSYELRLFAGRLWALSRSVGLAVPTVVSTWATPWPATSLLTRRTALGPPQQYQCEHDLDSGLYKLSWHHERASSVGFEFIVHTWIRGDDDQALPDHVAVEVPVRSSSVKLRLLPGSTHWVGMRK
jgi:hypothetical protein